MAEAEARRTRKAEKAAGRGGMSGGGATPSPPASPELQRRRILRLGGGLIKIIRQPNCSLLVTHAKYRKLRIIDLTKLLLLNWFSDVCCRAGGIFQACIRKPVQLQRRQL